MIFLRKYWVEILLHMLCWAAVLYVLGDQGSSSTLIVKVKSIENGVVMQRSTAHSLRPYSFFTIGFLMLLFYSNVFWLFKKIASWEIIYSKIAAVAGWFVFIFFANYFLVGFFMDSHGAREIGPPPLALTDLLMGSWKFLQFNILLLFLFTLGCSVSYFFAKAWIANELLRKQLEASQLSTEIKFLKSQINPHFLFNTLNNLFSMAQDKGNDELADGISKLSGMMRYMIYESNAECVPLSQEIEYLKNCVVLNKLRYANEEAEVVFNYPEYPHDFLIAPMLFIPFVENAFKYGVQIGRTSQINISIAEAGKNRIEFYCENKNYSFVNKMDDNNSGIGLENVRRRLELVYPGKHELTIKNEEYKYTVILKIDLV